jgi:hypothetical protein
MQLCSFHLVFFPYVYYNENKIIECCFFFKILLVDRLDHEDNNQIRKLSFTVISIPLWITLIAWLTFSFGANDSNPCLYYFFLNKILFFFLRFFRVVWFST